MMHGQKNIKLLIGSAFRHLFGRAYLFAILFLEFSPQPVLICCSHNLGVQVSHASMLYAGDNTDVLVEF